MPKVFKRVDGARVELSKMTKKSQPPASKKRRKAKSSNNGDKPLTREQNEHNAVEKRGRVLRSQARPAEPCHCDGIAVNGGVDDGGWRCVTCGRSIPDDDPRLAGKRISHR